MVELNRNIADIEEELAMPQKEFERKLASRLREDIKANKLQLEQELKREF